MKNDIYRTAIFVLLLVIIVCLWFVLLFWAIAGAEPYGKADCMTKEAFRREVDRANAEGLTSHLAAQIHIESYWDTSAVSPVGARGLNQFMPPTWREISGIVKPSCAGQSPESPACAVRCGIVYMKWLLRRYRHASTLRDQWGFALAAYNRGVGNIAKDIRHCESDPTCNPNKWFGHVERHCYSRPSACRENREYPHKIFKKMGLYE